jgi:hypothetical protein
MDLFKLFIAPQVSVPADVLGAAGNRLKRYFDNIILATKPRKFSQTVVKLSPHSAEVGAKDLLIYVTQASLIVSLFDKVFEPGTQHQLAGTPGGGTKILPGGKVLSEVFWTGGLMNLQKDLQGIALANLMFHELAHNKHTSDPVALSNGEQPNGDYVHFSCGGGILQRGLTFGVAARLDINPTNIQHIARVLDSANPQETCGVFSDELGF